MMIYTQHIAIYYAPTLSFRSLHHRLTIQYIKKSTHTPE